MLTTIRKLSETWFFKGILLITALSFMSFFGVGGIDEIRRRHDSVITVGDISITAADFSHLFAQEVEKIRKGLPKGTVFTDKDAVKAGVVEGLVKTEVASAAMRQTARDLGLSISDDMVKQSVLSLPDFQNVDGTFNRRAFEYFLSQNRMSEAEFLDGLKTRGVEAQLIAPAYDLAYVSKAAAKSAYANRYEKRGLSITEIPFAGLSLPTKPTAEEIQNYYDSDKETAYMNPEYRALTVLTLPFAKIFDGIEVSDDEILARYNENKSRYVKPEQRDIDQMHFSDEASATKAAAAVRSGSPFRTVAKNMAGQSESDTHLGLVDKSSVLEEVADDLFKAKKNALVGPVKSAMGWHLFKVLSITPEEKTPYTKVAKTIKSDLQKEKGADTLYEESYKVDDFLGSGKSLEEASEKFGLVLTKVSALDINGNDKNGKKLGGIYSTHDFLSAAFGLTQGLESPMTELGDTFFVVRADEITPPAPKPLSEVKNKVIAAWTADKKSELAARIADDIASGKKNRVFTAKTYKEIGRDNTALPKEVLAKAFAMEVGELASLATPTGYVVIGVNDIVQPTIDIKSAAFASVKTTEEKALSAAFAKAFVADFASHYPTEIDKAAINKLFAYDEEQ